MRRLTAPSRARELLSGIAPPWTIRNHSNNTAHGERRQREVPATRFPRLHFPHHHHESRQRGDDVTQPGCGAPEKGVEGGEGLCTDEETTAPHPSAIIST